MRENKFRLPPCAYTATGEDLRRSWAEADKRRARIEAQIRGDLGLLAWLGAVAAAIGTILIILCV